MALGISNAAYTPDLVEHIPGIGNRAADILSRRFHDPTPLPPYLLQSLEEQVSERPRTWWQALPA